MSAFNQDNSRPKSGPSCWAQDWGSEGQVPGSGDVTFLEPTCALTRPLSLGRASAEKAEAVSPPAGCLHLNRGLGRLKGPQGHTERFHGVSQALGANLSLVAFQKHTMQATVFFLLDDCTWSGLFSLLPHGTQGNKSSNNSPCSWKRPQVSKVDPSTSHLSLPEVGSVLVPHYG